MAVYPTLETERLVLRAFVPEDAPAVRLHCSDRDIASTTLTIPHPYPEGAAEEWIASHDAAFQGGEAITLAITLRETGEVAGAIGLTFKLHHGRAEMGYWVGKPHWGRGYATEAGRQLARWGFEAMGLHRIVAHHMTRNPSSGAVMRKMGMRHEGTLRGHIKKWDVFEDLEAYGMFADELIGPG